MGLTAGMRLGRYEIQSALGAGGMGSPGDDESAGVSYSHHSPKGNRQMRRLLNQAANAAVKAKGSIFERALQHERE